MLEKELRPFSNIIFTSRKCSFLSLCVALFVRRRRRAKVERDSQREI